MTREGAFRALATLTAAYDRDLPEETARIYLAALDQIDDVGLQLATARLIAESRFFPTVAELLAAAMEETHPVAAADDAWAEVAAATSRLGRHNQPEWSDPLIAEAVHTAGGYRHLCDSELPGRDRAVFTRAYEAAVKRDRRERLAALDSGRPALDSGDDSR